MKYVDWSKVNKKTWWSFCPDWLCLDPLYVHNTIKPFLNRQIIQCLNGLNEQDISSEEKMQYETWINACKEEKYNKAQFL